MASAVVAVFKVSKESQYHGKTPPIAIMLALVSGVAIAIAIAIALHLTVLGVAPKDSEVWVATLGYWISTVIMITFVFVVRSFSRNVFPWLVASATGVPDAVASGLFQLASQRGVLSVVAVLGSLYPAAAFVTALGAAGLLAFGS
jgi:hypothetical protein